MTGGAGRAAGIAAVAILLAGAAAAAPAPPSAKRDAAQTGTVARAANAPVVGEGEDEPVPEGCTRARRRLWVDGEGWLVRRVTHCR